MSLEKDQISNEQEEECVCNGCPNALDDCYPSNNHCDIRPIPKLILIQGGKCTTE